MREDPFGTSISGDGRVLKVFGVLDELSVSEFRTALHKAIGASPGTLAVDLSGVYFLPSVALGVLVSAMGSGASLELIARKGCIAERVLGLTGLAYSNVPSTPVSDTSS